MSMSSMPTLNPCLYSDAAMLMATVDFPTPPLAEDTHMTLLTPGIVLFVERVLLPGAGDFNWDGWRGRPCISYVHYIVFNEMS